MFVYAHTEQGIDPFAQLRETLGRTKCMLPRLTVEQRACAVLVDALRRVQRSHGRGGVQRRGALRHARRGGRRRAAQPGAQVRRLWVPARRALVEHLVPPRRVFRACARADEQRAGRKRGLDGEVAVAVLDEPDVARSRHAPGGGRKIVDEVRDAAELGAEGRAYGELVDDVFVVVLCGGLLSGVS